MNYLSTVPVALAAFALFTACNVASTSEPEPADQDILAPAADEDTQADRDLIVGGFGPGDVADPGARIAYELVEEAIYTQYPTRALVDSVSLETQVVAGLNYRFRVEMTGSPEGRSVYTATVYRNLDDEYELTALDKLQ